jgi:trk system potassium uptake protein
MINFRVIGYYLGILSVLESMVIFLAGLISFFYHDGDASLIIASAFLAGFIGFFLWAVFMNCEKRVEKREGYLLITLCWFFSSLLGSLPFYHTGSAPSFTDAFFEAVSGYTTTGITAISNVELLSHGILFWRSMMQWIGGIGIIVLTLSLIPLFGIGGMNLFMLDVSGQPVDKLHPRFKETVKRLLFIYLSITSILAILLIIGHMPVFDSICHALTTISTGGFSTKEANIAFYDSAYIHYVLIIFMIIAGAGFSITYFALHFNFKRLWKEEEFRAYLTFIGFFTIVVFLILFTTSQENTVEESLRKALFQVSSIISTTGFITSNYLQWASSGVAVIMLMMLLGSCSSSAGGGIKVIRIVILIKNGINEMKRLIHPNAIIPIRIENEGVKLDVITNVLAFISVYILVLVFGIIVISLLGYDMETSIGAVLASIGNIGPGIGQVGPFSDYSQFSIAGKWFLSFLMILGRLELMTMLVLFSPVFWRK